MLHWISQTMAAIDAAPERLTRLPFLHGVNGADILAVVLLGIAFWMLYSLMDERDRKRRARAIPPALNIDKPKPEIKEAA